ncbi:efflux RND transporter periplasmic adaptor subunit [Flavobacterium psychrophilum]|uniref:efflux RND transporter periplasmic adaptor subunit n=1 Tax=Flavobacterium psychrophilum TaxID=96345 RepID=UPI0006187723|nr:efflux RND transporter periplasmic adaptor subunit [Flavobacterium psychrophilum]EKT4498339.1 efflux RND transporter periplasmic adaptor subunit [Flavobacterium psychrophilum]ELM3644669.1 efflux RND transporter periplasmic adaptor subunit [Flavobacterium psychrophilum]ELM3649240.1 efflux RND transporter periplasmic adaptor subunit [Flavobacterium psychrophilum]ELM3672136.1 efflux RND transporter periplasmic adaptor subunit [Flavobacterium psychrophilum]ELM3724800.1 efflux RND transporter pe
MTKKTKYIVLGIAVTAIIGAIYLKKSGAIGDSNKGKEVEIATITQRTVTETVSGTGKIQPEIEVKISSEVSGEIIALPVKEGQTVKKGDLLVQVNPKLYTQGLNKSQAGLSNTKAGLSQTDAQFKEAKASYERSKKLYDKGIISRAEWDKSVATYESAQAAKQAAYYNVQSASATVNESKENLGKTAIYAPVDGTISKLGVELGERVLGTQQMAGTEMMRVADLNNMEVEVDVNENDIVKISIGDLAKVEVDAYLKKEFRGIVTSISNSASTALTADQVTNFKVKVRIIKDSYQDLMLGKPASFSPFRPGMTATVDIITTRKENVIAVPISAVVMRTDTSASRKVLMVKDDNSDNSEQEPEVKNEKRYECVFVKMGDKVKLRIVTTGIQDDSYIEVLSGLKKGETIITGPYTTVTKELNPDDAVYVKTKKQIETEKKKENDNKES